MRFGVNLPNYGPATTPASMLEWARRLEDLGYHQLMVSDHVASTSEVETLFPAPFYDPFTVLAWLAGATSRVRLGTTVTILPYRHPLLVARQVANIDRLSEGRFVFGAAAGWAPGEFAALGVPYARRGARSNEYLRVMKAFWTQDVIEHDGEFVSFGPVRTGPRPVRPGGPEIWIGGHSAGALQRAVRYGDAWHPTSVTADWLVHAGVPALRDIAKRLNRPVPALAPRIKLRLTERPLPAGRVLGEGTLEQIHEDLGLLERLEAEAVILDPTFPAQVRTAARAEADLSALERLAAEVIDLEHGRLR
ncbi:TIGR03619 family F420-dependent LLM class oxidoreductase [Streptomyces sp. NRRL F-5123]|uniref:TIGR03619 family F420-dependent LLM class oxidoreductase n=1 Tax=Streptomyces sp. NRRL F-5123 TaxID=1463856 RepID=UPI0004E1B487|nr:TIGR03619 family F420-dependent LLM class oxidoreductase [Streptomyces sp. NRRL F-5123]